MGELRGQHEEAIGTAVPSSVRLRHAPSRFSTGQSLYILVAMPDESVTVSSRCDACEGALRPRARTLCDEHRDARRKEQARERARRYRRRSQGLSEHEGLTLSREEMAALRDLTVALLARENDLRAWSQGQRREERTVPEPVTKYFEAGVRVRKALRRLTENS